MAQGPSNPGLIKYFSAQRYDRYADSLRFIQVRQLQAQDWQAVDSTLGLFGQDGLLRPKLTKIDLAPYANDDGYIVYWVPELAPEFAGGNQALQNYINDVLHPYKIDVEVGRHSSVYVRCVIGADGQVSDVAEAIPHREWIPAEIAGQCVDAVRYMPPWLPGQFNGKPVRVNRLIVFPLVE